MLTALGFKAICSMLILTVLMVCSTISIQTLHVSTRWGVARCHLHGGAARQRQCTSLGAKLTETESSRPTDDYIADTFFNNGRNPYDKFSEQSAKSWLAVLRSFNDVHSTSSSLLSVSPSSPSSSTPSSSSMLINEDEEDGSYLDVRLVDDVDVVVKVVADIPIAEIPETLTSSPASYRSSRSSNTHPNERRKMSEGKVGYGTIRREVSVAFRDLRYLIETSQHRQPLSARDSSSGRSGTSTSSNNGASSSSSASAVSVATNPFNAAAAAAAMPAAADAATATAIATSSSSSASSVTGTGTGTITGTDVSSKSGDTWRTDNTVDSSIGHGEGRTTVAGTIADDNTAMGYLRHKALCYDNFTHLEINFLATKMMTLCGDTRNGGNWRVCGEVLALLRETQRGPDSYALTGRSIPTQSITHRTPITYRRTPFIHHSNNPHTPFIRPSHPRSPPHQYCIVSTHPCCYSSRNVCHTSSQPTLLIPIFFFFSP